MQQSFLMMTRSLITLQYSFCDLVFEPLLDQKAKILHIRSFSKQQAELFYELGYQSVIKQRLLLEKFR